MTERQDLWKSMSRRKMNFPNEPPLDALEAHLAGTLRRVSPPSELVQRLRDRIHLPDREEIVRRVGDWQILLLAVGGVLSGALLLLTVGRALYHLFGRRNLG
jgi:hypothetical protein